MSRQDELDLADPAEKKPSGPVTSPKTRRINFFRASKIAEKISQ